MPEIRKIAVVSDVHGNLPALEAVLADCRSQNIDEIWNLGDFTGYVPFPNEVIELLRKSCSANIIGNYDLKVLSFPQKSAEWKIEKSGEKYISFEWNNSVLSQKNRRYLAGLPKTKKIKINKYSFLLTHGSPESQNEGLISTTPVERMEELAKIAGTDVVLCGHTHRPMVKKAAGVLFVNAGSVGRPEGDNRACYAVLHFTVNRLRVEHRLVDYEIEKSARAIRKAKLPENFVNVLNKAASLDVLRNKKTKAGKTEQERLESALSLAKKCKYEQGHTHQVEHLALKIFDELVNLHRFGQKEKFLLRCGAILHDIGWLNGQNGHHKTALRIIMDCPILKFDFRDRRIIALLARYHRKAVPKDKHPYYRDLDEKERDIVCKLASILRVADGLDRTHRSIVKDVTCKADKRRILIVCSSKEALNEEFAAALEKGKLFEKVFARKLLLQKN